MHNHTPDSGRRRLLGCAACGGFSLLLGAAGPAAASMPAIAALPALGDPAHGLLPPPLETSILANLKSSKSRPSKTHHQVSKLTTRRPRHSRTRCSGILLELKSCTMQEKSYKSTSKKGDHGGKTRRAKRRKVSTKD